MASIAFDLCSKSFSTSGYIVTAGQIDFFARIPFGNTHRKFFLFTLHPGEWFPDSWADTTDFVIEAIPELHTTFAPHDASTKCKTYIEQWILFLDKNLITKILDRPVPQQFLQKYGSFELSGTICTKIPIIWITPDSAEVLYGGLEALPKKQPFPLTLHAFIEIPAPDTNCTLEDVADEQRLISGAALLQALLTPLLSLYLQRIIASESNQILQRVDYQKEKNKITLAQFASILRPEVAKEVEHLKIDQTNDFLFEACYFIGKQLGITIKVQTNEDITDPILKLKDIARASRFRIREVHLKPDWWKKISEPTLAFRKTDKLPVAILFIGNKCFAYFPDTNQRVPFTEELSNEFAPFGYAFYRTFPYKKLTAKDLFYFGLLGINQDIYRVLGVSVLAGLLGLAVPVAVGFLYDYAIPHADFNALIIISSMLCAIAFSQWLLELTRAFSLQRIEVKMDTALQAAVWDRVLSLPITFFRNYAAGDLAERSLAINHIHRVLSGWVVVGLLNGVFSVFNFVLLFFYQPKFALYALIITILAIFTLSFLNFYQIILQRKALATSGFLSGIIFQLISGVGKLKSAGAESRAFTHWATHFSYLKKQLYRVHGLGRWQFLLQDIIPLLGIICLYYLVSRELLADEVTLNTGHFLAFSTAFGIFLYSAITLSQLVFQVLEVVPTFERAKPILGALPEVPSGIISQGNLSGQIDLSHVNFRYTPDSPYILQDVSLSIARGEYVAIVGPSGAGKSTLLRLLLGFDKPDSGSIFYDGHDSSTLDINFIRKQIGVVLQDGKLLPDDIYRNIVGSSNISREDALKAIRLAGMEEDIKRMPMGLNTIISEGGGTLSGGQRQRIMIARALVRKPAILFFDEATSALDNISQRTVTQTLNNLRVTRVIIAHRLSTITQVDRIIVLDKGKIVQDGKYEELISQPGVFQELAKRQTA